MKRILFCCELGNGYGHLTRLLPLALALRARSHEVIFVVNDLPKAEVVLGPHGIVAFQCPLWLSRVGGLPPSRNYTDIIMRHGFLDRAGLRGVARGWRSLIALLTPSLIVLDHAPVALFATRGLGIPRVRYGDGFCCPPLSTPMQPFAWWDTRPDPFDAIGESNTTRIANEVGADLGLPETGSVAQLLAAEDEFLCTFAELDHYAVRAQAAYCGPVLDADTGVSANWPGGDGPSVFVYVRSEYPYVDALAKSLDAAGCRAVLHVPGLAPAHAAGLSTKRVTFSGPAVHMDEVRERCDIAICHGGYGTTHTLLLAGKPMLLLPMQMEQTMMARRIESFGAAIAVAPTPKPPDFRNALRRLRDDGGLRARATAFAAAHQDHDVRAVVDGLALRCEVLL